MRRMKRKGKKESTENCMLKIPVEDYFTNLMV
jgi:hypothetical protein